MGISSAIEGLFGDVSLYQKLLSVQKQKLIRKYPDPILKERFELLDKKFACLGPIVLCDSLLKDIGIASSKELLTGLGLVSFHISMHDDVVDETPDRRKEIGGLVYSGNIALLEGIAYLVEKGFSNVIPSMNEVINENHFRQQKVLELWNEKPPSMNEYFEKIYHIYSWTLLGPRTAIAYAGRNDLQKTISDFSTQYGYAIQLLDESLDIDDDIASGYWSYSLLAGNQKGIKSYDSIESKKYITQKTLEKSTEFASKAQESIPKNWIHLQDKITRLKNYMSSFNK